MELSSMNLVRFRCAQNASLTSCEMLAFFFKYYYATILWHNGIKIHTNLEILH